MAKSIAEFFLEHFSFEHFGEQSRGRGRERAYLQRRGYRTESFTYGAVVEKAFAFAHELAGRGIQKGDRVMLWGENSAEWVAVFFGCALSGVVVVPMDDGASADFALRVYQQVEAKMLAGSRQHVQECGRALAQGARSAATFVLEDWGEIPNVSAPNLSEPPKISLTRDDILEIIFTSGTTAEPRGVVITHGNVLANIAPLDQQMQPYLKYERLVHPLRFLNLLPLSHVFGQFLGMFLPPLLGGTVIFQNELKPSEIMATVRRERVSVVVSVPRVLQSLKQKIERDLEDRGEMAAFHETFAAAAPQHFLRRWWTFRGIRRQFGLKFWAFISGGAALDGETEEFWHRLGYAVIQGYGLTETTSLISVNHPFRLGRGSIGKVLGGREVKLGEDGEILVRGGGVASGYWDGRGAQHIPESGARNVTGKISDDEGWYHTGDIGAIDADGNLYFKGRKKEVIVTPGGTNVYPDDLEAALRRQPEVKDCVVVGMERGGNAEACAVLILREDVAAEEDVSAEEVVKRANQSLAEYQRMRMWIVWPEEDFPRTSTQKPRRNLIREMAEKQMGKIPTQAKDGLPAQPAKNARFGDPGLEWGTRVGDGLLSELIARVSGPTGGLRAGALRSDARLDSDLGLSSLDRVELLSAVEDRYQVDLSEARFSSLETVGDLERMLRGEARPEFHRHYHYPAWALRWPATWARLLAHYLLMRPAIVLLGWPRIEGREHLQGVEGPLLIVSNHIGDVDPGFILTALPARFRHRLAIATGGEALEALRTPPPGRNLFLKIYDRVQWVLGVALLNLFPLPRAAGFRRSFAYAGEVVDHGYNVLVFPEGRHTIDGKMFPFRAGIGLLARNLGIPVLPMRIDGLFEVKQAGRKFAAPWKISVRIGCPIRFQTETEPEKIAAELQEAVERL